MNEAKSIISKQASRNEEGFNTTCSSASKIKVIHTMIPELSTSWSKTRCYLRTKLVWWILLLVIHGLHWRKEGASVAMLKSSGSRYSMSRTYGPRDVISLVIPRLGDNKSKTTNSTKKAPKLVKPASFSNFGPVLITLVVWILVLVILIMPIVIFIKTRLYSWFLSHNRDLQDGIDGALDRHKAIVIGTHTFLNTSYWPPLQHRWSNPCAMKRCIIRCSFVEDFGSTWHFWPQHFFL